MRERCKFVAPLPSYCRVNPNLPLSQLNSLHAIVRGIDKRGASTDERVVSSQHTSLSHGTAVNG